MKQFMNVNYFLSHVNECLSKVKGFIMHKSCTLKLFNGTLSQTLPSQNLSDCYSRDLYSRDDYIGHARVRVFGF